MGISEFRINNLVAYNGKNQKPGRITAIIDDLIDGLGYLQIDFVRTKKYWEASLIPIPLNDDWLKRCKFKFKELGFDSFSVGIGMSSGIVHFYIGNYAIKIEFVHQLQNIYFSLTGKELIIKL